MNTCCWDLLSIAIHPTPSAELCINFRTSLYLPPAPRNTPGSLPACNTASQYPTSAIQRTQNSTQHATVWIPWQPSGRAGLEWARVSVCRASHGSCAGTQRQSACDSVGLQLSEGPSTAQVRWVEACCAASADGAIVHENESPSTVRTLGYNLSGTRSTHSIHCRSLHR